jgi:hypothetical protein
VLGLAIFEKRVIPLSDNSLGILIGVVFTLALLLTRWLYFRKQRGSEMKRDAS